METLKKRVKILEQLDNLKRAKEENEQRIEGKNQIHSRKIEQEAEEREE